MKRVIEKGNLAFNHMFNICDLCKRCQGFDEKDDSKYKCKYNTDKKGLHSGFVRNHMENFKCKYFKRNSEYCTCELVFKGYKTNRNGYIEKVTYKRGKFVSVRVDKF